MPFTKGHKINVGSKRSLETREKLRLRKLGPLNPNFGKPSPNRGKPGLRGSKNPAWKDGRSRKPGYKAFLTLRRHASKLKNGGSHTFEDWCKVKALYNFTCPRCHRPEPIITLSQDHIQPLSQGGTDNIDNIQPLCRSCNSIKNASYLYYPPPIKEIRP